MSSFPKEVREVLGRAVEAGRAALADLEDTDVPPGLRKVRAYSGGRLPAPLAASLLSALDTDQDLRAAALEKLDRGPSGADVAFLAREEGWWAEVAAAAVSRASAASTRKAGEDASALRKLEARLRAAADKQRTTAARWDQERARLAELARSRDPDAPRDRREVKALEAKVQSLESALEAESEDRRAAVEMVARLRDRIRRTARRREGPGSGGDGSAVAMGDDPITTARRLDLAAAAAPYRWSPRESEAPAARRDRPALPPGIRPDEGPAIDWVVTLDGPAVLLVDGYNVLYTVDRSTFATGRARARLIDDLGRLARRAEGVRVTAVFDSALPGDDDRMVSPAGVEVRFTSDDVIADDDIVAAAAAAKVPVVVITSDRDLQRRVEAAGALALFSEAFADWLSG